MVNRPLPPALKPEQLYPLPVRLFLLNERCTVFDDRDHDLMRPPRSHFPREPLEGQVMLDV